MSLVVVTCCQVEVSATGRSPLQGGSTECGVSVYDLETCTRRRGPKPLGAVKPQKRKKEELE
jgi:hypothetical protein